MTSRALLLVVLVAACSRVSDPPRAVPPPAPPIDLGPATRTLPAGCAFRARLERRGGKDVPGRSETWCSGVRVDGGEGVPHFLEGVGWTGGLVTTFAWSQAAARAAAGKATPRLGPALAVYAARVASLGALTAIHDSRADLFWWPTLVQRARGPLPTDRPANAADYEQVASRLQLVWRVELDGIGPDRGPDGVVVMIDARDGHVVLRHGTRIE
jgi:hypothetical protein